MAKMKWQTKEDAGKEKGNSNLKAEKGLEATIAELAARIEKLEALLLKK